MSQISGRYRHRGGLGAAGAAAPGRGIRCGTHTLGQPGSIVAVYDRHENFIGGKWLAPVDGRYRVSLNHATVQPICQAAESTPANVELALDAAHAAKDARSEASPAQRQGAERDRGRHREHAEMLAVTGSRGPVTAIVTRLPTAWVTYG